MGKANQNFVQFWCEAEQTGPARLSWMLRKKKRENSSNELSERTEVENNILIELWFERTKMKLCDIHKLYMLNINLPMIYSAGIFQNSGLSYTRLRHLTHWTLTLTINTLDSEPQTLLDIETQNLTYWTKLRLTILRLMELWQARLWLDYDTQISEMNTRHPTLTFWTPRHWTLTH